jgi:hypothetical protein
MADTICPPVAYCSFCPQTSFAPVAPEDAGASATEMHNDSSKQNRTMGATRGMVEHDGPSELQVQHLNIAGNVACLVLSAVHLCSCHVEHRHYHRDIHQQLSHTTRGFRRCCEAGWSALWLQQRSPISCAGGTSPGPAQEPSHHASMTAAQSCVTCQADAADLP